MNLVNGACTDCGAAVSPEALGIHQAMHDRARIEAKTEHQEATKDIPRAEDLRTPLGPKDIAARSGQIAKETI